MRLNLKNGDIAMYLVSLFHWDDCPLIPSNRTTLAAVGLDQPTQKIFIHGRVAWIKLGSPSDLPRGRNCLNSAGILDRKCVRNPRRTRNRRDDNAAPEPSPGADHRTVPTGSWEPEETVTSQDESPAVIVTCPRPSAVSKGG